MSAAPLYRLSLAVSLRDLNILGARLRVIPRGGDLGYALHAALTGLFGAAAPQPFRLLGPGSRRRAGEDAVLLAYSGQDEAALRDYAAMQSSIAATHADAARALPLESLEVRPMPTRWTAGRLLQFETRVRPVVRTSRNDPNGQNRGPNRDKNGGREIDAFLSAMEKAGGNLQAGGAVLDRQAVYRDWVSAALIRNGAASLAADDVAIKALKRTRLHTGDNSPADDAVGGKVEGPDIVAQGLLRVGDPTAFAALLARGVGRHRAFGFGMLLLAPPARGA